MWIPCSGRWSEAKQRYANTRPLFLVFIFCELIASLSAGTPSDRPRPCFVTVSSFELIAPTTQASADMATYPLEKWQSALNDKYGIPCGRIHAFVLNIFVWVLLFAQAWPLCDWTGTGGDVS